MIEELKKYAKELIDMGLNVEIWQGEDNNYEYFVLQVSREKNKRNGYIG